MRDTRTLGEIASTSDHTFFDVNCMNHVAQYGGCWHTAKWSIVHAIVLWGPDRPTESLRFVCSYCGSRRFSLCFRFPMNTGGHAIWPTLEHHAHMRQYRWRYLWRHGYSASIKLLV